MRKLHVFGLALGLLSLAGSAMAADYVAAPLKGANEVPVRDTKATGNATFKLSADGLSLEFKLIVANINNVVAAHVHIGAAGTNGPVVLFLAGPSPAGGGRSNGIIGQGTATAANLVGPLSGQPLSALVEQLNSGNTYVNVHTNDGADPIDTGAGDFPGGEIRAQIRPTP